MNRTPLDYLRDTLEAMRKANEFVEGIDYAAFVQDDKTSPCCAYLRSLERLQSSSRPVSAPGFPKCRGATWLACGMS